VTIGTCHAASAACMHLFCSNRSACPPFSRTLFQHAEHCAADRRRADTPLGQQPRNSHLSCSASAVHMAGPLQAWGLQPAVAATSNLRRGTADACCTARKRMFSAVLSIPTSICMHHQSPRGTTFVEGAMRGGSSQSRLASAWSLACSLNLPGPFPRSRLPKGGAPLASRRLSACHPAVPAQVHPGAVQAAFSLIRASPPVPNCPQGNAPCTGPRHNPLQALVPFRHPLALIVP
jgi:hypothetical protein